MAHYDIFRHHLAMKFPAYGHALWDPGPGNLYPAVEVGDVGYICRGKFRRLFNVFLPADHPSHGNFGVPEYHEQLILNIDKHIEIGKLSSQNFCSAGVTLGPEDDRQADEPKKEGEVTFACPMKEGAVLCLPLPAKGEDTVASEDFGKWIIKHISRWFAWARQLGLGVNWMEDIILVTGTHRTRSWTNVAFPGGQVDARASFGAKVDHRGDIVALSWQPSHEHNRGAVLNYGPDGEDLPEDQCIFIRGFHATRRLRILPPRLKAAAGPNPDPEGHDKEPDAELIQIPAVPEYRDPLQILLEYIAEEAPSNCDMVLVHDNDLAQLDGISHDTLLGALQSDVILSQIRSLKPTVYNNRIDLSSARNSASADTESAWVATLSDIFKKRSPSSTSSAPQSLHVVSREEHVRSYLGGTSSRSSARSSFYESSSMPPPPSTIPESTVPGNSSGTGAYMHPTYVYAPSQQPQAQARHSGRPPPIPPRHFPAQLAFPAQPAYPIGDHASTVPRSFDPAPYQPGVEYVNVHGAPLFPEGPQAHRDARSRGADPGQYGFATPSRPGPETQYLPLSDQSQSSGGSSCGEMLYVHDNPRGPPVQVHNQGHNPHIPVGFPSTPAQAQQLYDVRNQARQPHAPVQQPYAPPPYVGQKKALLVGINYSKHRDKGLRLKWGVYDAQQMARFLHEDLGFNPNNIRMLTDDQHKKNLPTEANIVAGMHWLVEGAKSGDSLFFYFSGHATQVEDQDGDEPEDGLDECLCAMDYNGKKNPPTGIVVDDTMHDIMVKPLPRGCRLTAVLDYCHSGILLDLPYIYGEHGLLKMNRPDIVERKRSEADVISLSACKDDGRAWEAGDGGALRKAFIDYMKRWGNSGTPLEVIQSVRAYMTQHGYVQRPQLSSSHWIDTDQQFIVTE